MASERRFGYEAIRALAIVMVVVTHAGAAHVNAFGDYWWLSNLVVALTRGGADLFLMITGALLLNRTDSLGRLWGHRVWRVMLPLAFWTGLYWLWDRFWGNAWPSGAPLFEPGHYHLWYLYALVGLYAFLPFLRLMWQNATTVLKIYYMAGWSICASLLPAAFVLLGRTAALNETFNLWGFVGFAGLLWLGAMLAERPARSPWLGVAVFLALRLLDAWLVYRWSVHMGTVDGFLYEHRSPVIVISTAILFWSLAGLTECPHRPLVEELAALSFGIYLVHPMLLEGFTRVLGVYWGRWHILWSMPLSAVFALVGAFWLIRFAHRVPWLEKLM